jgi:HTH-type transcriptional regulator/antitoxin MqsA
MKMICGACGEIGLLPVFGRISVDYSGNKGSLVELSHSCDECGAVLFSESDVRENKRSWNRFKKQFDLVPLGCEIRAMRERAGLTQREAAEIFGGGPVAFSKYESDDLIPDEAMINLLRLAIAYPETISRLVEVKGQHVRINTLVSAFDSAESLDWDQMPIDSDRDLLQEHLASVSSSTRVVKSDLQEALWLQ